MKVFNFIFRSRISFKNAGFIPPQKNISMILTQNYVV